MAKKKSNKTLLWVAVAVAVVVAAFLIFGQSSSEDSEGRLKTKRFTPRATRQIKRSIPLRRGAYQKAPGAVYQQYYEDCMDGNVYEYSSSAHQMVQISQSDCLDYAEKKSNEEISICEQDCSENTGGLNGTGCGEPGEEQTMINAWDVEISETFNECERACEGGCAN